MNREDVIWTLIDAAGDCWEWLGHRSTEGYGVFNMNDRQYMAHRLVFESLVGLVPQGLALDHLCRRRSCVNPDHLEPVTYQENFRRSPRRNRTTCKHGHSLADAFVRKNGSLNCRPCVMASVRDRRARLALLRDSDEEIQPVDPYTEYLQKDVRP